MQMFDDIELTKIAEARWVATIEILNQIHSGVKFEQFDQFSLSQLAVHVTETGWRITGLLGLLPLVDRAVNNGESVYWDYGYQYRLMYRGGGVKISDPHISILLDSAAHYYGVSIANLTKIVGYYRHDVGLGKGWKRISDRETANEQKYIIPASWNAHRPDILLNPASVKTVAMNIDAFLNWDITGRIKVPEKNMIWSNSCLN
jgi:hypothetical protein